MRSLGRIKNEKKNNFRYTAGVNGYEETRERQEGAVKIKPYNGAGQTNQYQPSNNGNTGFSSGLSNNDIILQVSQIVNFYENIFW